MEKITFDPVIEVSRYRHCNGGASDPVKLPIRAIDNVRPKRYDGGSELFVTRNGGAWTPEDQIWDVAESPERIAKLIRMAVNEWTNEVQREQILQKSVGNPRGQEPGPQHKEQKEGFWPKLLADTRGAFEAFDHRMTGIYLENFPPENMAGPSDVQAHKLTSPDRIEWPFPVPSMEFEPAPIRKITDAELKAGIEAIKGVKAFGEPWGCKIVNSNEHARLLSPEESIADEQTRAIRGDFGPCVRVDPCHKVHSAKYDRDRLPLTLYVPVRIIQKTEPSRFNPAIAFIRLSEEFAGEYGLHVLDSLESVNAQIELARSHDRAEGVSEAEETGVKVATGTAKLSMADFLNKFVNPTPDQLAKLGKLGLPNAQELPKGTGAITFGGFMPPTGRCSFCGSAEHSSELHLP